MIDLIKAKERVLKCEQDVNAMLTLKIFLCFILWFFKWRLGAVLSSAYVEELYLQTFHANSVKISFLGYHASVICTVFIGNHENDAWYHKNEILHPLCDILRAIFLRTQMVHESCHMMVFVQPFYKYILIYVQINARKWCAILHTHEWEEEDSGDHAVLNDP